MLSIHTLPIEIIQYIIDSADYLIQINIISSCKNFKSLKITNMYVPNTLSSKLNENILQKHVYITKLNLYDNKIINNINYLKYLTHLNISGSCIIGQKQINEQRELTHLDMNNNSHVTSLHHLTKLEKLSIMGCCKISENEINKLSSLKSLQISFNHDLKKEILVFYHN